MLRDSDPPERQIEKLKRINETLVARLERIQEQRGPSYALTRTAAVLEREVMARNRDLEAALTDLARTNTELARARESADEANRAKSRFLRAASHDLLQPLSAARLFLSHLAELSPMPDQQALLSHLTETIESAEELIRALSDIARLDSRNFAMNPGPVAIGRLFRRLIIDMQPQASARGIDLRFVASGVTVESDPVYLRQIAQNLIANALKYTSGRRVLVGLRRDGDHVWLEVLDEGPGIALRDQERIFNEFERLSRSQQPGHGLGLSIVQRACQQLGHRLELRSEPGRGSCFRVALPVMRRIAEAGQPGLQIPPRRSTIPLAGRRVLVIENDDAMRRAFTFLLKGWGMEVSATSEIAMARGFAREEVPDVVLSDYRLDDGETGLQALDLLERDLGHSLPALIVSAETADFIQAEAGTRLVEVLSKPVAEDELRRGLAFAIQNHIRQELPG